MCVPYMHSVVVCPPPLRLPRCLAAPSPPVSLSRLLVTSPPRLLGSSTPASSCTGCVALLLSALLPALLATPSLLPPCVWRKLPGRLSLSDLWASALGFSGFPSAISCLLPPLLLFLFFFSLLSENWLGKAVVRPIIFCSCHRIRVLIHPVVPSVPRR